MKKAKTLATGKNSLLQKLIFNNSYCWVAALCAAGISLVIAFCFNMVPFGDITILRMDMYHQYCPLFAEFYDRVTGLRSFLYSWETGMGSAFLGNFYNYLCSPSAIFVLLFGHENVPEAIAAMIFSKAAFAAASFTYYLKKAYGKHDFSTAAFGILYCMCGWFIAYYWDVMWVDSMVFFPFVVLGIERIIKERKPLTYTVALFLTLLTNYYMGYMVCIFSVLYFFVCYFSNYDFNQKDGKEFYWLNGDGKRSVPLLQKLRHSLFLEGGFTFAGAALAAGALAAFALVPVYFVLKTSYATSDTFPSEWNSYFSVFDFLANHLPSLEPTIRSSGEDVLPNIFCGTATVMLVPLYLFTRSVPAREKVANVTLLAVFYASFSYNVLNFMWHGFHYPSDLPYRFSFMYCFILITMAFKAYIRLREFSGRQVLGTGVAVLFFVIFVQELGSKNVTDLTVILSAVFIVTFTLVLLSARNKKYQQSGVAVLLLCCVIGETVCCSTNHYDIDQPKTNYAGDYQDFVALKKAIDKQDNELFDRMELTYNRARMDPAWYNYNGISTFTSMAYESLSALEKSLGLAGNNVDSYTYHLQTPVYNMMHALKYVVNNDTTVVVENDYYTELATVGKFTAYENEYYLPLGFCVNEDITDWYSEGDNPFAVQSQWLELASGVPDVYGKMEIGNINYYNVNEITSGLSSGNIYFDKTNFGEEGEVTFMLSVEEVKHCYLYVKSSNFDSIQIRVHDETVTQYTDDPYIYDLGIVSPEQAVAVIITIGNDTDYGNMQFLPYTVDEDVLAAAYDALSQNTMAVTAFSDTHIKGNITVPEGSLIYTSIPYDEGWKVTLNGKQVSPENLIALGNGLLCIKAEPGAYEIEFRFTPKGLILGIGISAVTLLALAALFIFTRLLKKKKAAAAVSATVPVIYEAEEDIEEIAFSEPMPVNGEPVAAPDPAAFSADETETGQAVLNTEKTEKTEAAPTFNNTDSESGPSAEV